MKICINNCIKAFYYPAGLMAFHQSLKIILFIIGRLLVVFWSKYYFKFYNSSGIRPQHKKKPSHLVQGNPAIR